ncbi:hypothetical protein K402DRAFT_419670 [Aulographum hederae CBS 113979]|uniref:ERF1 methyltransferase catalytic subunit MTQ2 n=1 Tax=Aulographum hederae CBS 113979 TaxID=1176131 RepID=A0A6G1H5A3_9PEZI|nr:hypothetical protein K402DRAFT_419670 [Aulographum hederae CBS 113979]
MPWDDVNTAPEILISGCTPRYGGAGRPDQGSGLSGKRLGGGGLSDETWLGGGGLGGGRLGDGSGPIRPTRMLPTPSTTHVSFDNVYEPAEDSFLLLDTLSSASETAFLQERFAQQCPLVVEVGTGSGVVLAFVAANTSPIFGHSRVLTLGTDLNLFACKAASHTVQQALKESASQSSPSVFLEILNTDLTGSLRPHSVDLLIFNPPYVPTETIPDPPKHGIDDDTKSSSKSKNSTFDRDSQLLALSYAGGADGMEVTNRLLDQLHSILHLQRGVAYILLCAQNKPLKVQERLRNWGANWSVEVVGNSGKKGGWEKLQILRVWRT